MSKLVAEQAERRKRTAELYAKGPERCGEIYCSPWCGGGCTHAAFVKATADAKVLATLLGPGWKPRVWENLGWHYSAISPCGRLKVHPGCTGDYIAFLGDASSSGGKYAEHGRTPRAAIAAVRRDVARDLADAIAMLEACG